MISVSSTTEWYTTLAGSFFRNTSSGRTVPMTHSNKIVQVIHISQFRSNYAAYMKNVYALEVHNAAQHTMQHHQQHRLEAETNK